MKNDQNPTSPRQDDRGLLIQQLQKRALQLRTAAQVSQAATSTPDAESLIQRVVNLARDRFGLYYAGLFLADEAHQWAVLKAGTGEAGQTMLAQNHRLKIGGDSMIGRCIAERQARIALDVGETAVRFNNPLLPQTRSELALPLISRGDAIGALTIQSDREAAFSEEDITVLQTMANQLANAINNAHLYAEAQEERKLLDALMDHADDMIFFKDAQSRFMRVNRAQAEYLGLSASGEAIGKTELDFLPAEHARAAMEEEGRVIQSGQPIINQVIETVDANGIKHWLLQTKTPLKNEHGDITGLLGICRDISAIQEAEAERERLLADVQRSERLLRSVIDATPDWIFIKDREHRYVLVNQGYADALRMAPEAFIGEDDLALGFPEEFVKGDPEKDLRGFWADDQQVMDSGEALTIPHDLATIDGEVHVFNTIKTPLRNAQGEVWGVLGIARDVTERERLLTDLERRSAQLQTAAQVSQAASSTLEPGTLIQRVVNLARDRFGLYYAGLFLTDEAHQWAVLKAGTGEAGQTMLAQNHRLKIGGDSMIGRCIAEKQARIALDVGETAVRFNNPLLPQTRSELALPLISRGDVIGALTIQSDREAAFSEEDITVLQTMANQLANAINNAHLYEQAQQEIVERRRAERALTEQAQALDAELEQIFFVASHHLQEPLRMVVSYAQLLQQRYEDKLGPEADDFIAYAAEGASRIQALINDMLAFSRIGTYRRPLEPVDMSAILDRVLNYMQFFIEKKDVAITRDPLPTVLADGVQMTQLLQNLLDNAIKFSRPQIQPEVHFGAQRVDNEWVFSVRDNGIGMEPQYYDRIFKIFQKLHSPTEYDGTGIGLAICQKIVKRHGGRIWVDSKPGAGSTFYFALPANKKLEET